MSSKISSYQARQTLDRQVLCSTTSMLENTLLLSRHQEEYQCTSWGRHTVLKRRVIEPSFGPWAAPIVLVKKRDCTTLFCLDYRKLNNVTRKDTYPLSPVYETLDPLAGAKVFTALDLGSRYWQVEIDVADREKTASMTHHGLFKSQVTPFGLCNAIGIFQRLMEFCSGRVASVDISGLPRRCRCLWPRLWRAPGAVKRNLQLVPPHKSEAKVIKVKLINWSTLALKVVFIATFSLKSVQKVSISLSFNAVLVVT